jgi:DNA-binding LacI/PurR family transcriptional regulator
MIQIASAELRYQAAIRGWDGRALARAAGISEATVSRALAGRGVRGITALKLVQALRGHQPIPELKSMVAAATERGTDRGCRKRG